jgi:hypothetical protein
MRGLEKDRVTLEAALAEAGASLTGGCTTPQDVAARLKSARCEGRHGDPLNCPLARWYTAALRERRALARHQVVSVDGTTWGRKYLYVHVRERAGRGADCCPPVLMPALLVEFASKFDSGGFPELGARRPGFRPRSRPPAVAPAQAGTPAVTQQDR